MATRKQKLSEIAEKLQTIAAKLPVLKKAVAQKVAAAKKPPAEPPKREYIPPKPVGRIEPTTGRFISKPTPLPTTYAVSTPAVTTPTAYTSPSIAD